MLVAQRPVSRRLLLPGRGEQVADGSETRRLLLDAAVFELKPRADHIRVVALERARLAEKRHPRFERVVLDMPAALALLGRKRPRRSSNTLRVPWAWPRIG